MKTIFITISRGSLIRNFFHTGVIQQFLDAGHRVVVLSPFHDKPKYFQDFMHEHLITEPLIVPEWDFRKVILKELSRAAVFNQTIYSRYIYQIAVQVPPSPWLFLPRVILLAPMRFVPGFKWFVRTLSILADPQKHHDYLFEKYHPDLVFVTSPKDDADIAVMKSAKRFKTKLICMPKSWDNLSNILFDVKARPMLVWNSFMKKHAVRLHGYRKNEIVITGAPQFDFYTHTEYLLSREEFCKQFGIDPKKKLILYGSSGANMCDEHRFVEVLQEFIHQGLLTGVHVLIRPHTGYRDDAKRFMHLESDEHFTLDTTDKQDPNLRDYWDPTINHLKHLYNSLYHADVMVNVGSTLTIDATVNNTPVINLKFDVDPNVDFKSRSVLRLFKADYLCALLGTNATWIVESKEAYLEALKAILVRGELKERETQVLIEEFAYRMDGKAAERIAEATLRELEV